MNDMWATRRVASRRRVTETLIEINSTTSKSVDGGAEQLQTKFDESLTHFIK